MIVHIFNSSIISGPETLVLPNLALLDRPVHLVFLLESRLSEKNQGVLAYAESLGLKISTVTVRSRFDPKAIAALASMLGSLSPEIVHAHDVKASTYALFATRLAKRKNEASWKLVSTHHGVRGRSGVIPKLYELFYSRLILRSFSRVLTVCSSDRKILLNRNLSAKKVQLHLNGVDRTTPDKGCREKVRESWGMAKDDFLIGVLGRLAPEKGLSRVIEVTRILDTKYPNLPMWRLVFIGDGALKSSLAKEISTLGLEKRVSFLGYRRQAAEELVGLDLLLSLSPAEGLPISLIEAGLAEVPVFSTRVDGVNDLIPDDDYGFLVDNDDSDGEVASKLAAAISNPAMLREMAAQLQKRVKQLFSGARWRSELLTIYSNLLEKTPPLGFTKNLAGCIIGGSLGNAKSALNNSQD